MTFHRSPLARATGKRLRILLVGAALLASASIAPVASAQSKEDADDLYGEKLDGRLRGYFETNVVMPDSSTALTYLALIGMTVLAAGVMFKNARRTHLD